MLKNKFEEQIDVAPVTAGGKVIPLHDTEASRRLRAGIAAALETRPWFAA